MVRFETKNGTQVNQYVEPCVPYAISQKL